MRTSHVAPILLTGSMLLLQGCYTQLATIDDREPYSAYEPEDTNGAFAESELGDSLAVADSGAVVDEWSNEQRPLIGFDYYYPSWYPPVIVYDPWYAWDPWGCTVAYPWWWERPWFAWGVYNSWYYYDRPWHSYAHSGSWYEPNGRSTTRTSGTRRSGPSARRDYDGVRSMSVGGSSSAGSVPARSSAGRTEVRASTPGTAGRSAAAGASNRPAPSSGRTRVAGEGRSSAPARSWSLPDLFGRSSGSSGSRSSTSTSSSSGGSDRSSGRTESVSRPAPSYSPPPSSSAPSRSSSPPPSSGGGQSSGGTRSSGSSRSR